MKAYFAIKYHEDCKNRMKIEEISSALHKTGIELVCVARDYEKWGENEFDVAELMRISFKEIDSSDFVLVDLTEKGVGIGIEAGYAYANKIPIITIAESSVTISSTLKGITSKSYKYNTPEELEEFFKTVNIEELQLK